MHLTKDTGLMHLVVHYYYTNWRTVMDRNNKEVLRHIRKGMRLKGKPPKVETPKSVYTRKEKHKRRVNDEPSFFIGVQLFFDCPIYGTDVRF